MKDQIRRLVRLQEILFEIRSLEDQQSASPTRLQQLEDTFQQSVNEIGAARLRHEELLKERDRLRHERDELTSRLQQLQQKLMQVSNQREYSAALNEIDFNKQAHAGLIDRIGILDTEIEALAGPATEADARIAEERGRIDTDRDALRQESVRVDHRLADLVALRGLIQKELPSGFFTRFEAICRARGGVAMAKVENNACSACRIRLRPHLINLVRRGQELVTCDSCRRILYTGDFDSGSATEEESPSGPLPAEMAPAEAPAAETNPSDPPASDTPQLAGPHTPPPGTPHGAGLSPASGI